MALGKPECHVALGLDAYITPGSELCIIALKNLLIFNVPSKGQDYYLPRKTLSTINELRAQFTDLPNVCASCPVFAQAFPNVPHALGY
jgi:hypothetical protein